MKKIALVLTAGLLGACSMFPNKNVAGTYQGELPCSDCDKIQAELVLNADNTYQYNTVYFKNGKQLTEHIGVEGSIFMCIESLFQEKPSLLQVEALEPTLIYALPKRRLEEVALHNVNIQILFRKILEESLIISQVHADLLRFETAQDRYLKLCKLMPQVVLRAPLLYVANYLQMTPETLSRVRAASLYSDRK